MVAFDFRGFRVLAKVGDELTLLEMSYDDLVNALPEERPAGFFFDGVFWIDRRESAPRSYAGHYVDPVLHRNRPDFDFRHFDRDHPPGTPRAFPEFASEFGRTGGYVWRGEPVRGVFVKPTTDDPDPVFMAGIAMFDALAAFSLAPEPAFTATFVEAADHVERIVGCTSDGAPIVTVRATDSSGQWSGVLTTSSTSSSHSKWTLLQRLDHETCFVWSIVLRAVESALYDIPQSVEEIRFAHAEVTGMESTMLSDLAGKQISKMIGEHDTANHRANSQRQLVTVGLAVVLLYVFSIVRTTKEQSP